NNQAGPARQAGASPGLDHYFRRNLRMTTFPPSWRRQVPSHVRPGTSSTPADLTITPLALPTRPGAFPELEDPSTRPPPGTRPTRRTRRVRTNAPFQPSDWPFISDDSRCQGSHLDIMTHQRIPACRKFL